MAGFLLNLGELAYRKEERIMVMPLAGLWSLALKIKRPARNHAPHRLTPSPGESLLRPLLAVRLHKGA